MSYKAVSGLIVVGLAAAGCGGSEGEPSPQGANSVTASVEACQSLGSAAVLGTNTLGTRIKNTGECAAITNLETERAVGTLGLGQEITVICENTAGDKLVVQTDENIKGTIALHPEAGASISPQIPDCP